jgi:hypothetical protein
VDSAERSAHVSKLRNRASSASRREAATIRDAVRWFVGRRGVRREGEAITSRFWVCEEGGPGKEADFRRVSNADENGAVRACLFSSGLAGVGLGNDQWKSQDRAAVAT